MQIKMLPNVGQSCKNSFDPTSRDSNGACRFHPEPKDRRDSALCSRLEARYFRWLDASFPRRWLRSERRPAHWVQKVSQVDVVGSVGLQLIHLLKSIISWKEGTLAHSVIRKHRHGGPRLRCTAAPVCSVSIVSCEPFRAASELQPSNHPSNLSRKKKIWFFFFLNVCR